MSYIPVEQQFDQFGNPIQQAVQQYVAPQHQQPMMMQQPVQQQPMQQMMQPQRQSPQRMHQPMPVVKSRPAPQQMAPQQQQVMMQPVQQMPVQQMPVQQMPVQQVMMAPQQQVPVEYVQQNEPVYYEEQPQFVEQVPVQYVEQPVQYIEVDPSAMTEPYIPEQQQMVQQPVIVKSAPPRQPDPVEVYQQPVKYVKAPRPQEQYADFQPAGDPVDTYYFDDIEPTETDIGDGADLDEGTVTAEKREPVPVITNEKIAEKHRQAPKVVKSSLPVRKSTQKNISPRITAMPTTTRAEQRPNTMYVKNTKPVVQHQQVAQQMVEQMVQQNFDHLDDQDFSQDDWRNIQKKIDKQYERKLKEVGDDALKKLKMFQAEHKALLEKTQYLIEHSRIEDEEDDLVYEQRPVAQTDRKVLNDRNRFFTPQVQEQLVEEEFQYKAPSQLKNSAKGPSVIRKSAPQVKNQQPRYEEQIVQSAPQQKLYREPVQRQPVQQFVQQPVYQQPVQMVPQQQYVPPQQPVQYVMPPPQQQQYQAPPQQQQFIPQQQMPQQQAPRSVKASPMRGQQQRPVVKSTLPPQQQYNAPETYSEQPQRYQPRKEDQQYSFGTRPDPVRNQTQKKVYPRNKSAPRDAFRDQAPSYQQQRAQQPMRDRSNPNRTTATEPRYNTAAKTQQPQPRVVKSKLAAQQLEEEPICVLKVELDGGQNVQLLRVFDGQIPEEIVEDFGAKFNVSENAKHKLLSRIYEQLQQ